VFQVAGVAEPRRSRNAVGVMPWRSRNARLNGPIEPKPASSASVRMGRRSSAGSSQLALDFLEPMLVHERREVAITQLAMDQLAQAVLGQPEPLRQPGQRQLGFTVNAVDDHQLLQPPDPGGIGIALGG
jgi:hypothetical protein